MTPYTAVNKRWKWNFEYLSHRRDVIEFDPLGEVPINVVPRPAQVDQHITRRPGPMPTSVTVAGTSM